ncbi:unnamed protein product [Lactuca virosa]|uniref:Secreted protein n=1 Tax=Lactuca virosa TaxID=75947 RepID=A0AAU9LP62_9ASTR|nr:unnamed protein product [Lactuca virosa]
MMMMIMDMLNASNLATLVCWCLFFSRMMGVLDISNERGMFGKPNFALTDRTSGTDLPSVSSSPPTNLQLISDRRLLIVQLISICAYRSRHPSPAAIFFYDFYFVYLLPFSPSELPSLDAPQKARGIKKWLIWRHCQTGSGFASQIEKQKDKEEEGDKDKNVISKMKFDLLSEKNATHETRPMLTQTIEVVCNHEAL